MEQFLEFSKGGWPEWPKNEKGSIMKPTENPERWGGVQANKLPIGGCGYFLEQHIR